MPTDGYCVPPRVYAAQVFFTRTWRAFCCKPLYCRMSGGGPFTWAPAGGLPCGIRARPHGSTLLFHNGCMYVAGGWPVKTLAERGSGATSAREAVTSTAPPSSAHAQHLRALERLSTHRAVHSSDIQSMTAVALGSRGDVEVDSDRLLGRFVVSRVGVYDHPADRAVSPLALSLSPRKGTDDVGVSSAAGSLLPPVRGAAPDAGSTVATRGLAVPKLDLQSLRPRAPTPEGSARSSDRGDHATGGRRGSGGGDAAALSLIVSGSDDRAGHVAVSAPDSGAILFFGGESVVFGRVGTVLGDTLLLDTTTGKMRTVRCVRAAEGGCGGRRC